MAIFTINKKPVRRVSDPGIPAEVVQVFGIETASFRQIGYWLGRNADCYLKLAPATTEAGRRIRREAAILESVRHPGVAEGKDRSTAISGWAVLEVRAAAGRSLLELRTSLSRQEKEAALGAVEGILQDVNALGLLHADVNAGNVIWDGKAAVLIDFEEAWRIVPPLAWRFSPDRIGGAPCCAGPDPYGYHAVHCLASLRAWLLEPEFDAFSPELVSLGVWDPSSTGNLCLPETTPDTGSTYQTVRFGQRTFAGQRDPLLRFQYLLARRAVPFDGRRVLDVGCNFGRLSTLLDAWGVETYVGLDVNEGYWRVAREMAALEGNRRAEFILGDVCSAAVIEALLGRWPQGFDVCVCQSVYHHLPDKVAFLDSLDRIGCRWFIFEGPVDQPLFLLGETWEEEKAIFASRGFQFVLESWENDYPGRVMGAFQRVVNPASAAREVI